MGTEIKNERWEGRTETERERVRDKIGRAHV